MWTNSPDELDQLVPARYTATVAVQLIIAQAKPSSASSRAERGEDVSITRRGKPAVRLTPTTPPPSSVRSEKPWKKAWGAWAHLGPFTDEAWKSLDQPDPDVEEMVRKWETEEGT